MSMEFGNQSKSYLSKILQKLSGPNWLKVEVQSNSEAITSTGGALDVNIASGVTISASENLAQVNGATVNVGNGTVSTGTQRVAIASDNTPFAIKIDQTTPGTTNGVQINAGEAHLGAVGGNSEKLSLSVTTSSTAYTANDNIGGIQTLTNILRVSGGTGILQGLDLWSIANQKPNLYIDFWDASPATGTYTNDAAQVIAGDHASHLAFVEIAATDWKDTGTISRCNISSLGKVFKGNGSRNIYMTIQDKTGVTFGSTSGLFIKVSVLQD